MKIRPWLCALLMWSLLGGLTACSDSSEEVAALKAQVEELQAQVNATSTRAPAVTEAPALVMLSASLGSKMVTEDLLLEERLVE